MDAYEANNQELIAKNADLRELLKSMQGQLSIILPSSVAPSFAANTISIAAPASPKEAPS